MLYKFKSANNGSRLQECTRRKHGVGSDAASVAHERPKLVQSSRDSLPINVYIYRVILALVVVVTQDCASLDVHVVADDCRLVDSDSVLDFIFIAEILS